MSLLQRHDAKFVIVGAYAMAAHGRPRATQDLDVFVQPSVKNAERVARALDEFGYPELAKESVEAFANPLRMASLADFIATEKATGRTKDLLDVKLLKEAGL